MSLRSAAAPRVLLWTVIVADAAGFAALSTLRHRAFGSGRFDLGNMVQAVWATAHGHPLQVTNLKGQQISRLSAHFDVLLAAFAPLWRIWPSPALLLTVQAAVLALGALPVFWLARRAIGSERAGLGFAIAYLLYPPVQWLALDDFHTVALAPTFLLFALWYLREERLVLFGVFAVLAMTTREEVGLVVAAFGVCYAIARKQWLRGAVIAVAGVAVTAFAVLAINHYHPNAPLRFANRYADVGGSPFGVLKSALADPGHVFSVAFDRRGVRYLLELFLPLAGLWLFAPLLLLSSAPQLALNLLAKPPTQTSIHFHYTAPLIPGIVAAAIFGAGRLTRRRPNTVRAVALVAVGVGIIANYRLGAVPIWRHVAGGERLGSQAWEVSGHDHAAARALRVIPANAVVSASNTLGAHLSARRRILSFPLVSDARWIAVDRYNPSYYAAAAARRPFDRALARIERGDRWCIVVDESGVLVLRRTQRRQIGTAWRRRYAQTTSERHCAAPSSSAAASGTAQTTYHAAR